MENSKNHWMKRGLIWGGLMYLSLVVILPLLKGEAIGLKEALLGLPIWFLMGLVYGYATMGMREGK